MPDPRLITAVCYAVVGLAAVGLAVRIWWTHPINRAFSLGPFVTEQGLRMLLGNVNGIFALGMFAFAAGLSRFKYWEAGIGASATSVHVYAWCEMLFAAWAASCVLVAAVRLCCRG